ncbi:MAG TPA: zinc-dependent alcohol dehydrogenase, partial [Citricoccus sp.]
MVEALDFYARGLIHPTYTKRPLADVNAVFDEMHHGKISGRVVIDYEAD